MKARAVAHDALHQGVVQPFTAKPHRRRHPPAWLTPHVVVRKVVAVKRRWFVRWRRPGRVHGRKLLVENRPSFGECHANRDVFADRPAHGGLNYEATFGQEIEGAELFGERQWVPKGSNDGGEGHPKAGRGTGDSRCEHHRVRPWCAGVLISRCGVIARVGHRAGGGRIGAKNDVLGQHHRVHAAIFSHAGEFHEAA